MTGRVGPALLGWAAAQVVSRALRAAPPGGNALWDRANHRGGRVSLTGGPSVALAATLAAAVGARPGLRATTATLGTVCAVVGGLDDLLGSRPSPAVAPGWRAESPAGRPTADKATTDRATTDRATADKGFAGHLAALRAGRVSTGAVKLAVVGGSGLLVGARIGRGPVDAVVRGAVIAGTANLVNLLDLRPGRALKAVGLAALPLLGGPHGGLLAGPLGAVVATLPDDLGERVMIRDTGANALGALLGLRLALGARSGPRLAILAVLVALNLASERVSFTRVIEATPGLRELDALGRRSPVVPAPGS